MIVGAVMLEDDLLKAVNLPVLDLGYTYYPVYGKKQNRIELINSRLEYTQSIDVIFYKSRDY